MSRDGDLPRETRKRASKRIPSAWGGACPLQSVRAHAQGEICTGLWSRIPDSNDPERNTCSLCAGKQSSESVSALATTVSEKEDSNVLTHPALFGYQVGLVAR